MKFHVRQDEMNQALTRVKNSKAIGKEDDESSTVRIKTNQKDNIVEIAACGNGVFSKVSISLGNFASWGDDASKVFSVESDGEVFLNGHTVTNMISTYPENSLLEFEMKKETSGAGRLNVLCKRSGKKGRIKTSSFVLRDPDFFEADPPQETRETATDIDLDSLKRAVDYVEFATSTEEQYMHLWGVNVEVYKDRVSACATDKTRFCWHDPAGRDSSDSPVIVFKPIRSYLISVLKNLVPERPVTVHAGERYTVIEQTGQSYAIPNAVETDVDKFPDWRAVAGGLSPQGDDVAEIKFPRTLLEGCVKSACVAGGSLFGLKIMIDTENKIAKFSVEKIESNTTMVSLHSEEEPLDDEQINGNIVDSVILNSAKLQEALSRFKSDNIIFRIKSGLSPVEVMGENDNFSYLSTIVVPTKTDESEEVVAVSNESDSDEE